MCLDIIMAMSKRNRCSSAIKVECTFQYNDLLSVYAKMGIVTFSI